MTQKDIAAKADRTPMWVSRRFRGDTPLTVDDLLILCKALGTSPVIRVDGVPDHVKALEAERFGPVTR